MRRICPSLNETESRKVEQGESFGTGVLVADFDLKKSTRDRRVG